MSLPFNLLLRLPPALRCHAAFSLRQPIGSTSTKRTLSKTSKRLQSQPPKPTLRNQAPKAPKAPPKPSLRHPPPPKAQPGPGQPSTPEALIAAFRDSKDAALLLYKAPSHTSFYISSYLAGSVLLTGGVFYMLNSRDFLGISRGEGQKEVTRKQPALWIQSFTMISGLMFTVFATTFFMGPLRLIKSVSLVKNRVVGNRFHDLGVVFEMRHPFPIIQRLPFVKKTGGGEVEAEMGKAFMDREIPTSRVLDYFYVPPKFSQEWTQAYFNPVPEPPRTVLQRLRDANRGLVGLWPMLRTDVRRMFLREGMVYVRISGYGNWKMDLQGCELLDEGRVLERCVRAEPGEVDRSWWGWFRGLIR